MELEPLNHGISMTGGFLNSNASGSLEYLWSVCCYRRLRTDRQTGNWRVVLV